MSILRSPTILVVFFAMAMLAMAQPQAVFQHRGVPMRLSNAHYPQLQANDWIFANQSFGKIVGFAYFHSKTSNTTVHISNDGGLSFSTVLDDSSSALNGEKLVMPMTKFFLIGNFSFQQDGMYFTGLCNYTYEPGFTLAVGCSSWKLPYGQSKPQRIVGLGDQVNLRLTNGANVSGTVHSVDMAFSFPGSAGPELFIQVYSSVTNPPGAVIPRNGIFQPGTAANSFDQLIDLGLQTASRADGGMWPTQSAITYLEYQNPFQDDRLVFYDRSQKTSTRLIQIGQQFMGETVTDFTTSSDAAGNTPFATYVTGGGYRVASFNGISAPKKLWGGQDVGEFGQPYRVVPFVGSNNVGIIPFLKGKTSLGVDALGFTNGSVYPFLSVGDALPQGTVQLIGTSQGIYQGASFYGCGGTLLTLKSDWSSDQTYDILPQCIDTVAVADGKLTIKGANLNIPELKTEVLVDDVLYTGTDLTATANQVTLSAPPSPGSHKVAVRLSGGVPSAAVSFTIAPPPIQPAVITSLTSAAAGSSALAPGGLFTIVGKQLAGCAFDPTTAPLIQPGVTVPTGNQLLIKLGGAQVLVDGRPTPLSFAATFLPSGNAQINGQMSFSLDPNVDHSLVVRRWDCQTDTFQVDSTPLKFRVASSAPAFFGSPDYPVILQDASKGYALVQGKASPNPGDVLANRGDALVGYATGFGQTSPPLPDGVGSADALGNTFATVVAPAKVFVRTTANGNTVYWQAELLYNVASPQFAGVYQIAFRLPPDMVADSNQVFLIVQLGDQTTEPMLFFINNQ
jgi:uncharacterized protein (TIGR03437 family)